MSKGFLHLSVVFKAANLNYGESVGNILSLKKLTSEGKNYSYISRQALRYDIIRLLNEIYEYKLTPVNKEGGVIQFELDSKIDAYPEIDFFGYMKTSEGNKIRKAVVRLTDAVSLEPFNNETDFGTNKGLADRIENNKGNDIYQPEIHTSYYNYSISCNLNKIGRDPIYDIDLDKNEKITRLSNFLEVVKLLERDIRGKKENLSPVFIIGGIYNVGNPFFYNRIQLSFTNEKKLIGADILNDTLKIKALGKTVEEQTAMGFLNGVFTNTDDIQVNDKCDVETFFDNLKQKIQSFYN